MAKGIEIRAAHFPGRPPIDAYGAGGFRFADMSHRGSILCLPSGVHGWNARAFEEVTHESLARVFDEAEDIEVLLIGMGPDFRRPPKELQAALREKGIVTDAMSTGSAVRTYNVLLAEDRAVAAALIAVDEP
ncbi:MAG: Mth938-like domain-containing protein [Oricola sp.]